MRTDVFSNIDWYCYDVTSSIGYSLKFRSWSKLNHGYINWYELLSNFQMKPVLVRYLWLNIEYDPNFSEYTNIQK